MTKKSLLSIVAGVADATFDLAGVKFMAAPLTVLEYAEYLNVSAEQADDALLQAFAAYPKLKPNDIALFDFLASRLRLRIVSGQQAQPGQPVDPALITALWLASNIPQTRLSVLTHLLVHGALPDPSEKKVEP
ncbi:hypothetical protein [Deinococcus yunweiensis]|uniref:hypothetical protein n=1 Tax=Deinococcus yunweiensis TaxID=367282 RepID=UPI00398F7E75